MGTSPESIDLAEDRDRWNGAVRPARDPPARRAARPPPSTRPWPSSSASATRCSCARPTCSAGGPWRSSTTTTTCAGPWPSWPGSARLGKEGGLSAERPVLVDRFLEDATEVDCDAIRDDTGDVRHRRDHGARRGGRRALRRQRLRAAARTRCRPRPCEVIEDVHPAHRRRARRHGPDQRAVRREERPGVRDRGQPPGVAHGAVRGQGHRRAAGQGGGPGDARRHARRAARRGPAAAAGRRRPRRREGGGAALQPLPRGRQPARSRDALDRRGHGHRPHRRPGLRQEPAGRRHARCPQAGTVFLSLADRDKARRASRRPAASSSSASPSPPPPAPPPRWSAAGVPVATVVAKLGEPGTDAVELISSGKVDLVVNSPRGRGPRADGAHIRAAADAHRVPLLTTGAAGLAAAGGMADWQRHELRVRSLQEYHAASASRRDPIRRSVVLRPGARRGSDRPAARDGRPRPRGSGRWRCPTR